MSLRLRLARKGERIRMKTDLVAVHLVPDGIELTAYLVPKMGEWIRAAMMEGDELILRMSEDKERQSVHWLGTVMSMITEFPIHQYATVTFTLRRVVPIRKEAA